MPEYFKYSLYCNIKENKLLLLYYIFRMFSTSTKKTSIIWIVMMAGHFMDFTSASKIKESLF